MGTNEIIKLAVSGVAAAFLFVLRSFFAGKNPKDGTGKKKNKKKTLATVGIVIAAWYFIGTLISHFSKKSSGLEVNFELFSERVDLFGFSVAGTTLLAYLLTAIALIFALIFRFAVYPRFKDRPGKLQNLCEAAVEEITKFTDNATGGLGEVLASYMMSLALFMYPFGGDGAFRAARTDLGSSRNALNVAYHVLPYKLLRNKKEEAVGQTCFSYEADAARYSVQNHIGYRNTGVACLPTFRKHARRNDSNGSSQILPRRIRRRNSGGCGTLFQSLPPAYSDIYIRDTFAYLHKRSGGII